MKGADDEGIPVAGRKRFGTGRSPVRRRSPARLAYRRTAPTSRPGNANCSTPWRNIVRWVAGKLAERGLPDSQDGLRAYAGLPGTD
ncbi:hypothetical protein ACF1DV_28730 [Streptomyces achromogenes]|uniref:hypothetical protein n=1 Tax=Streptomyces achromogenes TaxID=67255 RepID=UPI0036FDC532